jgi:hypothetical protein
VNACEALPFKPKLSLRLTGRKQIKTGRHPGVRAIATQARGEAGIRSARVSLPLSLALDPANARELCSVEGGLRASCPKGSIVGSATAVSPILRRPLKGPVYFVQGVRTDPTTGRQIRTLPTLLATLRGEVAINLRAATAVERGRLVTTFPAVPDAPVSRFELRIKSGKGGILVANRGLCGRAQRASASFAGHNGKGRAFRPRIGAPLRACPARLAIGGASWSGSQLDVKGRIAKTATKRVRIVARCGGARASKRVKPRRGRWGASLSLPAACAGAERLTLTARYPGGGDLRKAKRTRTLSR